MEKNWASWKENKDFVMQNRTIETNRVAQSIGKLQSLTQWKETVSIIFKISHLLCWFSCGLYERGGGFAVRCLWQTEVLTDIWRVCHVLQGSTEGWSPVPRPGGESC